MPSSRGRSFIVFNLHRSRWRMALIHGVEILQGCRRAFSWKQISTILILAVGLTLTTVMFAVGYGYSSFSIPFKNAEQLVTVGCPAIFMGQVLYDDAGEPRLDGMSASQFFELKERSDVFVELAAYRDRMQEMYGRQGFTTLWKIRAPKQNASFPGLDVTDNYFDVLGISFRGLQEWKQYRETTTPVPLIVTHGTGMRDFGYDAVGKEFPAESVKINLLGILPDKFLSLIANRENLGFSPLILNRADDDSVKAIARLAPGVTPRLAEQMLSSSLTPPASISDAPEASRIIVQPVQEEILKPSRRIVLGAWLMGGLILILCVANVAGVYLIRCNYHLREFAVKSALGADFLDLIRPLFLELIVLSGIAAVIAAVTVKNILTVIANMVPVTNMAFGKPASGWIVFVFLLVCMIVMVIASLIPAVMVVLKNYRQGFYRSHLTMFHRHKIMRMILVVSQSAIAMLLLAISIMAVRGYIDLFNKDIGVDSSVLVTSASYSWKLSDAKIGMVVNETLEALRGGNPDARVAVCVGTLFDNSFHMAPYRFKDTPLVRAMRISPGFFRTARGRLLAGREFDQRDKAGAVVLLNAALAKRLGWSPQEAVGQIIQSASTSTEGAATVIGVASDFLSRSWEDDSVEPTIFLPIDINSMGGIGINYIVHPDALRGAGSIEQAIYKLAPEAVITRRATWDDLLNSSASGKILATFIVVIFTIAAIVIVATGIVNTTLFTIARRTREIAVHIALGAPTGRVFWIVMRDMVVAGIIGLLLGTLASWWAEKATAHFFYHGAQHQGLSGLMLMMALMLSIVVIAAVVPALRLLRIEPSRALVAE
jgi:predicted permease